MIDETEMWDDYEHSYDTYYAVLVPKDVPIEKANETRRLRLKLEEDVSKHDSCVYDGIVNQCDVDRITLQNHWTIHTLWPVDVFPQPQSVRDAV